MSDYRPELIQYITERFAKEDEVLKTILEKQKAGGGPMMNIGPDQGKFLKLIVQLIKAKNILEVGSYYGYSSIWLARGAKEVDGKLDCVEVSSEQCKILEENFKLASLEDTATVHQGSGIDIMNKFIKEGRLYNIVFIDADKSNYVNYLDLAHDLLPVGGLLLVDNCIWDSKVLNTKDPDKTTQAIQAFNDKLAAGSRFSSTIVTVQDGLAFALKN